MSSLRLRRSHGHGQAGTGASAALETLEAGLRPDCRRALLAGALALAALAAGSDLGGLHASELHTKLIVIALAVAFVLFGVITARSTANQVAHAARHASVATASTTRMLCLLAGYLVVFLGTLGLLTIPLQQLLVGGALTGVIVGIAAQQPLSNLFAGLVLLITRPLAAGQWVRIHSGALGGPLEGSVLDMGLIYTTLSTERETLHIPNSGLLSAALRAPTPTTCTDQDGLASGQHR